MIEELKGMTWIANGIRSMPDAELGKLIVDSAKQRDIGSREGQELQKYIVKLALEELAKRGRDENV